MISVNGAPISETDVLAEMQYHPAASRDEAAAQAAEALIVRELLLQRASAHGLDYTPGDAASEEKAIAALLDREIRVPEADEETCRRWYGNNPERFRAQPLFEASHILYLAPRDDAAARTVAKERALAALARLKSDPSQFAALARAESKCSSAGEGGRLGQVAIGETAPEIETFLLALEDGQVCPVPIETDYGVHVVRLHRHIEGKPIPFDDAASMIARELCAHAWRRAVSHYISLLAASADVQGFDIKKATSPLMQ